MDFRKFQFQSISSHVTLETIWVPDWFLSHHEINDHLLSILIGKYQPLLITVGCFFSNLSYQSLSFKIEFGAFVMVFTIAQGPRQLMPLFFGIKLVFKDLLNIQTRIFKQRYTIFLIWLRNEWTSGRAWVWWFVQQIDH